MNITLLFLRTLVLASVVALARASDVSIPDPALAPVIHEASRAPDISISTNPQETRLTDFILNGVGEFQFLIAGPPGNYIVSGSADLVDWSDLGVFTNEISQAGFIDTRAEFLTHRFYRAARQPTLTNMIFVPPNTFRMGTPIGEPGHQPDESPQTIVTLTRGFWMGKYEVTQREYLAVVGANPSGFPGNLDRPVETVSWMDATNYCGLLTKQELLAGHISSGSHFRLPTEAEWECAARAGTSTRFSYGDDANFTNLTNNAWYSFNSGFGTHPVGQKTPNPWGLYDMAGNVLEWCLDWYGQYPGGVVTDPKGPASNSQGAKVIRGGAWDSSEGDCRSGRRLTQGASPFITDFIIGFRVVLITEPQ
jgi:formylglycine-generating enzyme required for sulfatase activity